MRQLLSYRAGDFDPAPSLAKVCAFYAGPILYCNFLLRPL